MKTFKLLADCTFEAESIDDAFKKLEDHFRALQEEMPDDERLFTSGEIRIYPVGGVLVGNSYHRLEPCPKAGAPIKRPLITTGHVKNLWVGCVLGANEERRFYSCELVLPSSKPPCSYGFYSSTGCPHKKMMEEDE